MKIIFRLNLQVLKKGFKGNPDGYEKACSDEQTFTG